MGRKNKPKYVWKDRKHTFLGLPLSFTRYRATDSKLILDIGFFSRNEDEVRLYRITDLTLRRSFFERMFGLGTIHCCAGDKTMPEFDIKHIRHSKIVKDMLSDMVEKERNEKRVGIRENMGGFGMDDHSEYDPTEDQMDDIDDNYMH
ncbi:MAG: PH domain-containing protein [Clostridiales bacterium]|nr:PH domain-containing protein [Clostridiales bacterium]